MCLKIFCLQKNSENAIDQVLSTGCSSGFYFFRFRGMADDGNQ